MMNTDAFETLHFCTFFAVEVNMIVGVQMLMLGALVEGVPYRCVIRHDAMDDAGFHQCLYAAVKSDPVKVSGHLTVHVTFGKRKAGER